jgi:hypothetical protein
VSDEVRDWATFGLGTQLAIDGVHVRSALMARIDDSNGDVRDEALVGLARRRDRRALTSLQTRLQQPRVGRLPFEAANYFADSSLMPMLQHWGSLHPDDPEIRAAIQACEPDERRRRMAQHIEVLRAVQEQLDADPRRGRAALWCERFTCDVLLGVNLTMGTWDVDRLLVRAGHNTHVAARLVMSDVAE